MKKSDQFRAARLIARRAAATYRPGFRQDYLADRAALAANIRATTENGRVAVVESGRDCDGVHWYNHVTVLTAIVGHVERHLSRRVADAEGPLDHRLEIPSIAAKLRYHERDLALEAFENGHPHILRPHHHHEVGHEEEGLSP